MSQDRIPGQDLEATMSSEVIKEFLRMIDILNSSVNLQRTMMISLGVRIARTSLAMEEVQEDKRCLTHNNSCKKISKFSTLKIN